MNEPFNYSDIVYMEDNQVDVNLVKNAYYFAYGAHSGVGQLRKYSGMPYIVHPKSVMLTYLHTEGYNSNLFVDTKPLCAALLHDVVEDTSVTISDIAKTFGVYVSGLVDDLTDVSRPEDGNRKARKAIDLQHLMNVSLTAKKIKLCDVYDNAKSFLHVDDNFRFVWGRESLRIVEEALVNTRFETEKWKKLYDQTVDNLHKITK